MGTPQNNFNVSQIELQPPEKQGLNPLLIVGLIGFGIAAIGVSFYPWPFFFFVLIGGSIWALTARYFRLQWEAKERAAIATSYACICGPEVITAMHPNESVQELQNRANNFRASLRDSGNPYWNEIPVIIFPYEPVLSLPGHLSMSWNTYRVTALTKQYEANMTWLNGGCPAQLKGVFASQVMKMTNEAQN